MMDFLCDWLIAHPDVTVVLNGEEGMLRHGKYIHIKFLCDNGARYCRIVDHEDAPYMKVIFDRAYTELISEGGSV